MSDKLTGIIDGLTDEEKEDLLGELLGTHWKFATGHERVVRWAALGRAVDEARDCLAGNAGTGGKVLNTDVKKERMRAMVDMLYAIVRDNVPEVRLDFEEEE